MSSRRGLQRVFRRSDRDAAALVLAQVAGDAHPHGRSSHHVVAVDVSGVDQ
jgi:hypothetical protein